MAGIIDPPEASDDELDRMLEEELGSSAPSSPKGSTLASAVPENGELSLEDGQQVRLSEAVPIEVGREASPTELDHMEGRAPKRRREDDSWQGEGQLCPPHPGSIHGICFRCGQLVDEPASASVALRYIHQGLQLSATEAERVRARGLQKVLEQKKLILVLDLDHTLLNSTGIAEVDGVYEERLKRIWESQQGKDDQTLFRFQSMWTKLRPFVREFLEAAQSLAEMHVYTHGGREYAKAMANLLDPHGKYFNERIISQADSTKRHVKDLDVMLGAESAVLILDDTVGMWPMHRDNLIQVERYIYFPADAKRLGARTCLLELGKEESADAGQLAIALDCLRRLHTEFYSGVRDVRVHLRSMRTQILAGVVICFTAIIPQNASFNVSDSPVYQLASQLGAKYVSSLGPEVTHVVAGSRRTDKAIQAANRGLHVVSVDWLSASGFLWRRMDEKQFSARDQIGQELKSDKEDAMLAARAAGGGLKDKDISSDETPL